MLETNLQRFFGSLPSLWMLSGEANCECNSVGLFFGEGPGYSTELVSTNSCNREYCMSSNGEHGN